MKNRLLVALGVTCLAAGIIAAVALRGPGPEAADRDGGREHDATVAAGAVPVQAPPCRFDLGDVHSYDVRVDATFELDPNALTGQAPDPGRVSRQTIESSGSWTLTLRVIARNPERRPIVAVRFEDYTASVAGQDAVESVAGIERPFLVELDDRCRVVNVARERTNSPEALLVAQSALDQTMVLGPENPEVAGRYTGLHRDSSGQFVARYVWVLPTVDTPRRAARVRDSYLTSPSDAAFGLVRDIVQSRRDIVWGPGAFFESFTGIEQTSERTQGGAAMFASVTERSSAVTVPARRDAFDGLDLSLANFVWGAADYDLHADRAPGTWLGRPLDEALAEFQSLYGQGGHSGMRMARELLVDYLRDNPEAALVLANRVRAGEFTEIERAVIAHVLSEVGTPQARQALLDMAFDTELDENSRTQAAAALGDLVNPDVETIERLEELSTNLEDYGSEYGIVNSAARMSIGNQIYRNSASDDLIEVARGALDRTLSSDDPMLLRQGLAAVANTGDEYFLEQVEAAIRNDDQQTRQMAARATRRMEIEATDPIFAERLRDERNTVVIAEMADAQRVQVSDQDGEPSGESLDAFERALWGSRDEVVRGRIIELLGTLANEGHQRAREILISYFPREQSRRLQELIGEYVTGEELAGG